MFCTYASAKMNYSLVHALTTKFVEYAKFNALERIPFYGYLFLVSL